MPEIRNATINTVQFHDAFGQWLWHVAYVCTSYYGSPSLQLYNPHSTIHTFTGRNNSKAHSALTVKAARSTKVTFVTK